jgi:6-phosphogluconate dehydrogenase
MQIGVIGLGRMGGNIVRRLTRAGHSCAIYDANPAAGAALAGKDVIVAASVPALVEALGSAAGSAAGSAQRTVWVMLPAGKITEDTIAQLGTLMKAGDVIIDGGNTNFKDDVRRARELAPKGIKYLDIGTSGGVWGLARGYCLMIGGDAETVKRLDPIFAALAPGLGDIERTDGREKADPRAEHGYIHAGPVGAGHFVKMIHNGIEYGMMQAFAEGFDIMRHRADDKLPADERYDLNLGDIAEGWRRGSVVTSWLLDLTASALAKDAHLESFSGHVEDSGEGRWTIEAAIEEAVPADVLAASLFVRFRSRQQHTFAEKVLSAMRLGFGGHVEAPKK